jgi:hypothetical protein
VKSCGPASSSPPRRRGPRSKRLKSLGSRFRGNDGYKDDRARFHNWITASRRRRHRRMRVSRSRLGYLDARRVARGLPPTKLFGTHPVKQGTRRVVPEPGPFDQAAAQRPGHLLVLAGEIVLADHLAEVLEHVERLARRMQCLALRPGQQFRSPDRIGDLRLVVLGDRRKARDLPVALVLGHLVLGHGAAAILLARAIPPPSCHGEVPHSYSRSVRNC